MLFYTKRQHQKALDAKCEEIYDGLRDLIVKELKSFVAASDYEEKYMLAIREKGYYERIRKDIMDGKVKDTGKYLESYDLAFNRYLLDKIKYEDGELLFYVDSYHSLPPDYGTLSLSEIPSKVLYLALMILKEKYRTNTTARPMAV